MKATPSRAVGQGDSTLKEATSTVAEPAQKLDRETGLADVTGLSLSDLLELVGPDNILAKSLRQIAKNTDSDAIAGFSQGLA